MYHDPNVTRIAEAIDRAGAAADRSAAHATDALLAQVPDQDAEALTNRNRAFVTASASEARTRLVHDLRHAMYGGPAQLALDASPMQVWELLLADIRSRFPRPPQPTLPPGGRWPYVGDGADGCLRSAQIDEEEAHTLAAGDPRVETLLASAARWRIQASWHRGQQPPEGGSTDAA